MQRTHCGSDQLGTAPIDRGRSDRLYVVKASLSSFQEADIVDALLEDFSVSQSPELA
jgi:hypothetical protein